MTETPEKKAAAAASPKDSKPVEPVKLRRRIIWATIWSFVGVNFLMIMRFFFPRTLFEPKTIFTIGTAGDFGLGVETKFQQDYRIWVVKKADRLFVIYARCTHLGCTPDWKPSENKFKCPCHGSGYDSDGVNFEGPAPRPMDRAYVEMNAQGQVVVDTARLFLCEKGKRCQFDDPGAFIPV
ncbi:MAG: Rieske 2Fe-2S domain-containing protein [Acidobacteria bacterium]|nr:Rieske 2Fe-2S domain-containing protein [Acidobacteriota bacterium]